MKILFAALLFVFTANALAGNGSGWPGNAVSSLSENRSEVSQAVLRLSSEDRIDLIEVGMRADAMALPTPGLIGVHLNGAGFAVRPKAADLPPQGPREDFSALLGR